MGLVVSDGRVLQNTSDGNTCIGLFKAPRNEFIMGSSRALMAAGLDKLQQAVCGFGFLVENGEVIENSGTEIAPRTAVGVDKEGNLLTMVIEGSEVQKTGTNLTTTAKWMKEIGAQFALNLDGGGSSTTFYTGNYDPERKYTVIQGVPTGTDIDCFSLRAVQTVTCIKN